MRFTLCVFLSGMTMNAIQAAPITGSLWQVSNAIASDAILSNVPSTTPDVTFEVNAPLNFNNGGSVNAFLTSGGAFDIVGSPAALSRAISPSLIEFTGQVSVTDGQTFTVAHDDGLTLLIGGISVIDVPGPTPPTNTTRTYSGPTGIFPFTLVYGECCGGYAVLRVDLPLQPSPPPSGVPEPTTVSLAAGGLLLVASRFRSYSRKART